MEGVDEVMPDPGVGRRRGRQGQHEGSGGDTDRPLAFAHKRTVRAHASGREFGATQSASAVSALSKAAF